MNELADTPAPKPETTLQPASTAAWSQRILRWVRQFSLLVVLAILASLLRTYLDISENFSGMESTAMGTSGFYGLWLANIVAAGAVVFLIHFFLPRLANPSTAMMTFKPKHLGYLAIYAFFLPAFLSMDLKAAQFFPVESGANASDQTELGLQEIYNEFTKPARRNINAAVRKEILSYTENVALNYGCEKGIEDLRAGLEIEVRGSGNLEDEERVAAEEEIATILTREPTDERRAQALGEMAIRTFGLDHITSTFTSDICIWRRIAAGYACADGLPVLGDAFFLAIDQSTLSPEQQASEKTIIQRNLERETMSDMNKALRIVNKTEDLFGARFTQELYDENLCSDAG